MKEFFSFMGLLIATNLKASFALRTSFMLQAGFMVVNNLVFFTIWWIFFQNVEFINGWGIHEIELMYALAAGSFGLSILLFGGYFELADMISEGKLDSFLTKPKNILIQSVCAKSRASGWGDFVVSLILIIMSGYWNHGLVLLPLMIMGSLFFLFFGVLVNSLAFWGGAMKGFNKQLVEMLITFCVYPQNIFGGFVKLVLFTVVPAAYISYLPVKGIVEGQWWYLIGVFFALIVFMTLSTWVFYRGLKVYESGSTFTYNG